MSETPPKDFGPPHDKSKPLPGSLKDRIAKFNNPSAPPLVPVRPFGYSGPVSGSTSAAKGGMIGNRIPSLDPKSSAILGSQSSRKTSENKGLVANRIPSFGGGAPRSVSGRSASPAGSQGSSVVSGQAESTSSPVDSRASSPPTSPGTTLPTHLLASTLPDNGGPGAATPSSTIAEVGEEPAELSLPSTPIPGTAPDLPLEDLSQGNLSLASAPVMARGLSASSGARIAPSVSSSVQAQYESSTAGGEEQIRDHDVSGISTPTSTPRRRDFEGSLRGDGSVMGEGSVVGDDDHGISELGDRLKNLDTASSGEAEADESAAPVIDISSPKNPAATKDNTVVDETESRSEAVKDDDPNKAPDLEALKKGELHHHKDTTLHETGEAVSDMANSAFVQNVAEPVIQPEEKLTQGGAAGQRMEDVDHPDEVVEAPSASGREDDSEFGVEEMSTDDSRADDKEDSETQDKVSADTHSAEEPAATEAPITADEKDVEDDDLNKDIPTTNEFDNLASEPELQTRSEEPILPPNYLSQSHSQPIQIHIEPAPIAQPASPASPKQAQTPPEDVVDIEDLDQTPSIAQIPLAESKTPDFPEIPKSDPDDEAEDESLEQPAKQDTPGHGARGNEGGSAVSTPIDAAFLKSFPEVPDKDKPGVEIHVSPHATLRKSISTVDPNPTSPKLGHSREETTTEKSLSTSMTSHSGPGDSPTQTPTALTTDDEPSSVSPIAASTAQVEDGEAPKRSSLEVDDLSPGKVKRTSKRVTPKSPLLDDEDPGDFEGGEGWAVVTKGRET